MEDFRIKYRPTTMSEVWGNERVKMIWNGYLKKGYFPRSIILSSNFGMGKTTIARIMGQDIVNLESKKRPDAGRYEVLEIDSTICDFSILHRNIASMAYYVVRPIRAVFIDEAHRMLPKAQEHFLKVIEDCDEYTFIFATANTEGFEPGLLSRSDKLKLAPPSKEILTRELGKISVLENIKIEQDALDFLIEFSGFSPRECLGNLQLISHYEGIVSLQNAKYILLP